MEQWQIEMAQLNCFAYVCGYNIAIGVAYRVRDDIVRRAFSSTVVVGVESCQGCHAEVASPGALVDHTALHWKGKEAILGGAGGIGLACVS